MNGQILSQNDVISGETITYQYDTLKRLVSANTSGDPHGPWSQNFAIDGFGNLNQISGSNGPSLSVGIDYTTNRIQSSSAYDANGNMSGYSGSTYAYDVENRMTQSNPASGGTVLYGYDSTNQRVYKGLYNGSTYSGEEIYFYGAEGHKYGTWQINPSNGVLLQASVTKKWFGNRLVSPQDRLDSRGKYFPFGQERTNVTPVNPPNDQEKFASYTRDSATGLDYADQRYYNNLIGRFMRPDPFGRSANPNNPQTWNRYAYVGNDPANNFDPEGLYGEGEGDYGDFSTDDSGNQGAGGSGAFAPLPAAPPMQLNAPDAANGTSNSGTYNGTALFSDTSTCPPNCGSTMANIDQAAQSFANFISPITDNPVANALSFVGGLFAGVPEESALTNLAEDSTTLYRAVQEAELSSIQDTGMYSLPQGMSEVKGFFGSPEEATTFAQRYYGSTGGNGGPFTLTSGSFPSSTLPQGIGIAGEGTAYFLPSETFPTGPVNVFNSFPLP